ncbi:Ribosome-recycling factor [Caldalkalibacillus thermarum TA2.A1]|uniref:Ribosome-recycling factor n=1 Tax=Caldalkalibacillus thermarum (strain TA2.A1) TaxID=986075 RepID=F5L4K9_CALTT|nr:ribosome recycling factor [Caldalkalibacillus thermarum]EGL83726.1 Ribosome-recycling factor [Caldalkalibacillus thermarum TA2.A1]QZT32993.1 ribosome recycling factor [Caldalkalibacillus thermarum TA2.A1]
MVNEVIQNARERMDKAVNQLKTELASLRAGRATPALLDKVYVDYYGTQTPVNQLANISAPEPRLLTIQPWDKSALDAIEKAILKSELGLTPNNDGNIIRITIPALTEERRQELVKMVKKYGEDAKVAIRNIRRDANESIKKIEKEGGISEDESRRYQDTVQKATDEHIAQVDQIIAKKEKEIMEV